MNYGRQCLLDRPLEPVIGRRLAPTRWRATVTAAAIAAVPNGFGA